MSESSTKSPIAPSSNGDIPRPDYVWEAEARRLQAEATRAEAEARRLMAEAAAAELHAQTVQIAHDREMEKRQEELTSDKYHQRYVFTGEVAATSVNACIKQLQTWVRQADGPINIRLVINSPGGEIFAGFALIDFLFQLRAEGHVIVTEAIGMAASMAGVILQAGETRVMGEHAFLLIHEAQFSAVGSFGDIEDRVELVKMMHERILDLFTKRSRMTKAQIKKKWERRDWWISASEAHKLGFVDEIGVGVSSLP